MTTPTPEQIAALVEAAEGAMVRMQESNQYYRPVVEAALAPFLPSEEDELVEAMTAEMVAYERLITEYTHPQAHTYYKGMARAALQVVKASPFWKEPGQ